MDGYLVTKLLNIKNMWVARNKDNTLLLWLVYPNPIDNITGYYQNPSESDTSWLVLDSSMFPDIKWESGPVEVSLIETFRLQSLRAIK